MIELKTTSVNSQLSECLQDLLSLNGALVVALGSWRTGACLAAVGTDSPAFPNSKIELAVAGNTKVIQAKMTVAETLKFDDDIQDILISLTSQWHLIRLLSVEGLFIYIAMDRSLSNIAAAHLKLIKADRLIATLGIQA